MFFQIMKVLNLWNDWKIINISLIGFDSFLKKNEFNRKKKYFKRYFKNKNY